jgi:uncharacterized membrane protein
MNEKPRYSRVTLAGHPVHPMLVGFPVAFYTATFVGFVIFATTGDPFWYRVAYVANVAGVVMAVVAAIPGFLDWTHGIPERTEAKRDGAIHMMFNVAALLMFTINLTVGAGGWHQADPGTALAFVPIVLSFLGVVFTLCAGWFGWRMVQTHHVGVQMSEPAPPVHERFEETRRRSAR